MDAWLILLRIVHIGSAMTWFGGAIIGGFFLQPAARALGPAGQPFMNHLVNQRRMGVFFPIVATLTIVSGAGLYWIDSGGLSVEWVTTPTGLAFTIGAIAAIVAYAGGFLLIGPAVAEQTAVQNELAVTGGEPGPTQRQRLERADRRMQLANRIDLPLALLAGLMMAVARYL